jgi:hypothetical protein
MAEHFEGTIFENGNVSPVFRFSKRVIAYLIDVAHNARCKVSVWGQAPSDCPGPCTPSAWSKGRDKEKEMEETKEAYVQKREAELKELNARLDLLESEAAKASGESKIGYGEQIFELQQKRRSLEQKLEKLRDARGESWKDLKDDIQGACLDLRTALDVAATRFEGGESTHTPPCKPEE